MRRSKTIEVITAIDKALGDECGRYCMDNEEDRARMAWWIFNSFIKGDLVAKAERREPTGLAPIKGSENK